MKALYVPDHDLTALIGTLEDLCMDERPPEPAAGGEFYLMVREADMATLTDELSVRGITFRLD